MLKQALWHQNQPSHVGIQVNGIQCIVVGFNCFSDGFVIAEQQYGEHGLATLTPNEV